MSLVESEQALLCLVIPDLDVSVVPTADQLRSVEAGTEVNAVDSGLVTEQAVVGARFLSCHRPNLNRLVEGGTRKHRRVLRVDCHLHDVVVVVLVRVRPLPVLVPIKKLNSLIIRATQDVWHLRMNCKISNEIRMLVNSFQFLTCVVVEDTDLLVICTYNDPLLPSNKLSAADWSIRDFK